jgi:uncharacterized membrane protein
MSADDQRSVTEPGEQVYPPRSSWLPPFLAFAIALVVCGVYAQGFMVRGWIYSVIGAVAALLVFRAIAAQAGRDYFRLRRKQKVRGAVLPVETLSPPAKRG